MLTAGTCGLDDQDGGGAGTLIPVLVGVPEPGTDIMVDGVEGVPAVDKFEPAIGVVPTLDEFAGMLVHVVVEGTDEGTYVVLVERLVSTVVPIVVPVVVAPPEPFAGVTP